MAEQNLAKSSKKTTRSNRAGFSLIEVVFALGIVAFTCVTILGALPLGLASFQQANGLTVEAQIVQDLSSDMLLANFSDLNQYTTGSLYYDNLGVLLPASVGSVGAIYTATVTLVPTSGNGAPACPAMLIYNATPSISAYNVKIAITAVNRAGKKHYYSLIAANNNL